MSRENKNPQIIDFAGFLFECFKSRVDWIRTSDPLHPIQVRYRAAPPPERDANVMSKCLIWTEKMQKQK